MGRHSSPNQGPFYRSLAGWLTVWAVIAAATGVGVWVAVNAIGAPDATVKRKPAAASTPSPSVVEVTPTVGVTPSPSPTGDANEDVRLVTKGVTVQVLNGTLEPEADDAMSSRLQKLGFTIVSVLESSRAYSETTVFWSFPDAKRAAIALGERFGWIAEPKPRNLSTEVALHVVVGADES